MIDKLVQLKNAKSANSGYPCLFDDGNIEAMFRLMDPEGRGFITSAQFAEGKWSGEILQLSVFVWSLQALNVWKYTLELT